MSRTDVSLPQLHRGFGRTSRLDAWWAQPLLVFLGLGAFVVYSTWAAFQGEHYHVSAGGAHYLSPFYSPEVFGDSPHAWLGSKPQWWPLWLPFSPALLILWAPGGFRFTCYYYRGAYYKAFWADPPSCAVGEPRKGYRGEHKLPLRIQNIHRYFLYLALVFIVILSWDAFLGFRFTDEATGRTGFGVGVGSLILLVNVILLGGGLDRIAGRPVRRRAYDCVSCLNRAHMRWAWASLFWVGFTDLYIRLVSMGIFSDPRLL